MKYLDLKDIETTIMRLAVGAEPGLLMATAHKFACRYYAGPAKQKLDYLEDFRTADVKAWAMVDQATRAYAAKHREVIFDVPAFVVLVRYALVLLSETFCEDNGIDVCHELTGAWDGWQLRVPAPPNFRWTKRAKEVLRRRREMTAATETKARASRGGEA